MSINFNAEPKTEVVINSAGEIFHVGDIVIINAKTQDMAYIEVVKEINDLHDGIEFQIIQVAEGTSGITGNNYTFCGLKNLKTGRLHVIPVDFLQKI
jgi:hypothetical protein